MNREVELLKIQIFADYCHTDFTFRSSIGVSGFVGLLLVTVGLVYQNLISLVVYYLTLVIVLIFFSVILSKTYKDYHTNLDQIQVFFTQLEKNESLPTLREMRKAKK